MTGSPCVTENPSLGTATLSEKALELIRWQPVQWQAMVRSGGALILSRTCPQRQPPSAGKFSSPNDDLQSFPPHHRGFPSVRLKKAAVSAIGFIVRPTNLCL